MADKESVTLREFAAKLTGCEYKVIKTDTGWKVGFWNSITGQPLQYEIKGQ